MVAVLLGFEDEIIGEHYNGQLNLTIDKIGGKPDYPSNVVLEPPVCPLCRLPRPLVIQMYSPLDSTIFHRTLFLFACINPNCWNFSESWICIRVQAKNTGDSNAEKITADQKTSPLGWCAEADEWGDDNGNLSEENGNVINNSGKVSDEDDESSSSNSLQSVFQNLTVDDRNANQGAEATLMNSTTQEAHGEGGAVGRQYSPSASAQLEGNDDGVTIFVDTPTYPQRDITALLHEAAPLPQDVVSQSEKRGPPAAIQFTPYFVSVWEEPNENHASGCTASDRHVKELLLEYQQRNEGGLIALGESDVLKGRKGKRGEQQSREDVYETSCPAHGDKMFHNFLSKVQANRGQIFRYSRDSDPLLLYPLIEQPKECRYCKGKVVFEFQLIPTIISKLKLSTDPKQVARLEFGTVLVYTCQQSCWSSDTMFRLETVILQKEVN